MAAQTNGPLQAPMYTIEQIELIRRLRNSGISKEQLVQAFDSLDRLDRELGPVYTIPLSMSQVGHFVYFIHVCLRYVTLSMSRLCL